ncbi:MAG: response regulator [Sandaracinaceae bacterium]|nr:response regulator [Sandaracinaceae bacterium]
MAKAPSSFVLGLDATLASRRVGCARTSAVGREWPRTPCERRPRLTLSAHDDLVMEGVGGFEFMRRYTERFESLRTPFLFVSALGDDETLTECLEAGADDYIAKPVASAVLRARAAALLRRSGGHDRHAEPFDPRKSVRLSTVAVNGRPLSIETRLVREPALAIVTVVRAGEREVVRRQTAVAADTDPASLDRLRARAHAEAESLMRDKVSSLRYQQLQDRSAPAVEAATSKPDVQQLFDQGVGHALDARWADALAAWERALALSPDDAALQCNVEVARRKLGR